MRLILKLILIITFSISVRGVRAEEPQNTPKLFEFLPSTQTSLLPPFAGEQKFFTVQPTPSKYLTLLNLGQNGLKVTTQYIEKPVGNELRSLSGQQKTQGQVRALATSSIIERLLTAEGEWAFNSIPADSSYSLTDDKRRLLRFGLKGALSGFSYGAEYRSVGKEFINLTGTKIANDQAGGELWAQQTLGIFSLKASVSDYTNNVAQDPTIPRTTKILGGATVSVAPPSWPIFSIFYSRGSAATSTEPADFSPESGPIQNFGASLFYQASEWDALLSSSYSLTDMTSHSGTAAAYQVQTDTPFFSVGLNYRPSILPVQVSAFGSYSKSNASDGYTNSNLFNLSASLNWTLGESRAGKSTLSLGTTLNRYLDNIDHANSNRDVSVWVRLKLAAF